MQPPELLDKAKQYIEGAHTFRKLRSSETGVRAVGLTKRRCLEDGAAKGALSAKAELSN